MGDGSDKLTYVLTEAAMKSSKRITKIRIIIAIRVHLDHLQLSTSQMTTSRWASRSSLLNPGSAKYGFWMKWNTSSGISFSLHELCHISDGRLHTSCTYGDCTLSHEYDRTSGFEQHWLSADTLLRNYLTHGFFLFLPKWVFITKVSSYCVLYMVNESKSEFDELIACGLACHSLWHD